MTIQKDLFSYALGIYRALNPTSANSAFTRK